MKQAKNDLRQRKAIRNIKEAANWLIGENENTLSDCSENSPEYASAKEWLADHAGIVREVYALAIHCLITPDGCCCSEEESAPFVKDIKFLGKNWLLEQVENEVVRQGY